MARIRYELLRLDTSELPENFSKSSASEGVLVIVDSSLVGYDGVQNVRDAERSVDQKTDREPSEEPKQSRWGFRGKTVWSWLQLLIVPLVLVVIGLLFEMQQAEREERRAEAERELAEQRAQDEALQAYLDQMSTLLLEKDLRNSEVDSEVRTLAQARTLTVLGRLDPSRRTAVMQFLVEAELVQGGKERPPIIALKGASLGGADLSYADLSYANLHNANVSEAMLGDANLRHAYLSGAYGYTQEELAQAASLEGATMPNGQKYEEWLKSKGRGEEGENSGPS